LRPASDLSKLVVALKIRFLDLLDEAERCDQVDLLIEGVESELARLIDLRGGNAQDDGPDSALVAWLDHDISLLESRLSWLEAFRARL
jgi:hypothetical protein